ncbi:hypothetical protein GGP72_000242 [Salinibacter ruber]|uniref:Uncharacterized protein n=1 Tax=Salinibacter ruber TaxID=146919 RepID=A0A9X2PYP4_9BACT|nr:hypothetical protein [Salinibacter ruber]MCS3679633.1 hypothetical protein [Salinibacter ruber]MCS4088404.1 hypothetical protein [Salinibacter ruber]
MRRRRQGGLQSTAGRKAQGSGRVTRRLEGGPAEKAGM